MHNEGNFSDVHQRCIIWFMSSVNHPKRKVIRLHSYDYSQNGAYFVTIVTKGRRCLFGNVINHEMILNEIGRIVKEVWEKIPDHFAFVNVENYIIMPNHIHGIFIIDKPFLGQVVGTQHAVSLPEHEGFGKPVAGSLATIIRSFKSEVTRRCNLITRTQGSSIWQSRYYEHIIRNERDHQAIYDYILTNPANWLQDNEFCDNELQ